MFQDLMDRIKQEVVDILFKIQIASPNQVEEMRQEEQQDLTFSSHADESAAKQPVRRSSEKVQRNDPCPCGSGKKYKKMLRAITAKCRSGLSTAGLAPQQK